MSRWAREGGASPEAYDDRWQRLAAAGVDPHGEAGLVAGLDPSSVLDAGCGTGRVAIELARRGIDVVGVDLDEGLLARARAKAPELAWVHADLRTLQLGRRFDAIVMAGNVMIFLEPGSEAAVVRNLAGHLAPRGHLVAGFQLLDGRLAIDTYDELAAGCGLRRVGRFTTWDRDPWTDAADYAVSVHAVT
jgi:SAM-dependent methyltransferase